MDLEEPVIIGWQCPTCNAVFETHGFCFWDGAKLKVLADDSGEING